jgi:hypothetical protein
MNSLSSIMARLAIFVGVHAGMLIAIMALID